MSPATLHDAPMHSPFLPEDSTSDVNEHQEARDDELQLFMFPDDCFRMARRHAFSERWVIVLDIAVQHAQRATLLLDVCVCLLDDNDAS